MSVSFELGSAAVVIQNPAVSNRQNRVGAQVMGRSASGLAYVYGFGADRDEIELEWPDLRDDEKEALETFFTDTVNRMQTPFTFTDHNGADWTARFLDPNLDLEEVSDQRDGQPDTFTIGSNMYPTTTRKNPTWRVRLRMEISPVLD